MEWVSENWFFLLLFMKAGDYQIEFKIDNLRVGTNNVNIEIKDKTDNFVTDAKVWLEYSVPVGIDLPPMHFTADAELDGHAYGTKMKIPMPGNWATEVNIIRGGKTSAAKFYIETIR
jgi:hypothetical protein